MQRNRPNVTIRTFSTGDGPRIADAWTAAAPEDGITYRRFRDLVLLDRNFDPDGLFLAVDGDEIIGAAYAVRRLIAHQGDDLEPGNGWIPFFFVVPSSRHRGVGRTLLTSTLDWLRSVDVRTVFFSSYTPNYFLPGLDKQRYPQAHRLLTALGFESQYECAAMDRSLNDYRMPDDIAGRIAGLRADGYRIGQPTDDDLVDLIRVAGSRFNSDWARGIREAVTAGLNLDRIMIARDPSGSLLGWAMCGAYEDVLERFGPFGVIPESRGTGLGEVLLHLTLERMRSLGGHSAWFLWTGENSPAGHLYRKTGFSVTRTFTVMRTRLS
jgi:GNAT superfamily N-acetyltransferase